MLELYLPLILGFIISLIYRRDAEVFPSFTEYPNDNGPKHRPPPDSERSSHHTQLMIDQ